MPKWMEMLDGEEGVDKCGVEPPHTVNREEGERRINLVHHGILLEREKRSFKW